MNTSFFSLTADIGRDAFARANRDNARVSADQADLIAVLLFVAVGLFATAAFLILGAGLGQILAASG
jgi:ABC-type xylose transport system permease subunit